MTLPVTRLVVQYVGATKPAGNAVLQANPVTPDGMPMAPALAKPGKTTAGRGKPATPGQQAPEGSVRSPTEKTTYGGVSSSASDLTTSIPLDDGGKLNITVVQVEGTTQFRVRPVIDIWSSNKFSIQKLANTEIPTSVGNDFTDMTEARIQSALTMAAAVAKVAAVPMKAGAAAPTLDCTDSTNAILDLDGTERGPLQVACHTLTLAPLPPAASDTVAVSYLSRALTAGSGGGDWSGKVWPVPACMDIAFSVGAKRGIEYQGILRVIDPRNIEVLPVPQSGKIAMHPVCGADFSDSPTDKYQSYFDAMNAVLKALPNAAPTAGKQAAGNDKGGKK